MPVITGVMSWVQHYLSQRVIVPVLFREAQIQVAYQNYFGQLLSILLFQGFTAIVLYRNELVRIVRRA